MPLSSKGTLIFFDCLIDKILNVGVWKLKSNYFEDWSIVYWQAVISHKINQFRIFITYKVKIIVHGIECQRSYLKYITKTCTHLAIRFREIIPLTGIRRSHDICSAVSILLRNALPALYVGSSVSCPLDLRRLEIQLHLDFLAMLSLQISWTKIPKMSARTYIKLVSGVKLKGKRMSYYNTYVKLRFRLINIDLVGHRSPKADAKGVGEHAIHTRNG